MPFGPHFSSLSSGQSRLKWIPALILMNICNERHANTVWSEGNIRCSFLWDQWSILSSLIERAGCGADHHVVSEAHIHLIHICFHSRLYVFYFYLFILRVWTTNCHMVPKLVSVKIHRHTCSNAQPKQFPVQPWIHFWDSICEKQIKFGLVTAGLHCN